MKKILIISLCAASLLACKNNDKKVIKLSPDDSARVANAMKDSADYTSIQWLDSTYVDLGKQPEGKTIEMSYRFKNTGSKSLVIESVTAQCGCTIPEKPEKPVAPGEEGLIKAKYNGSGHGEVRKEVYVTANTKPDTKFTLSFRTEMVKE